MKVIILFLSFLALTWGSKPPTYVDSRGSIALAYGMKRRAGENGIEWVSAKLEPLGSQTEGSMLAEIEQAVNFVVADVGGDKGPVSTIMRSLKKRSVGVDLLKTAEAIMDKKRDSVAAEVAGAKVTVSTIMRSLRKRSVPEDFLKSADVMDRKLLAECRLFGTNESYDNLEAADADVETCMEEKFTSIGKLEQPKDFFQVLDIICSVIASLNQCYAGYAEALAACAPSAARAPPSYFPATPVDFICEAGRLESIMEDEDDCFGDKGSEVLDCIDTAYPEVAQGEGTTVTSSAKDTFCSRRESLQKCVREPLEKCKNSTSLRSFDEIVSAPGSSWSCPSQ